MDGDQFSLCWNNFHNNLSSGFHSLFKDEDMVDVTLAVEGKYIKAHKAVLSICSPYFKELFNANPCKHPIVILPEINYDVMSNLLEFMYQGEVSVSQEDIPSFMRVAEVLKVKGLTENGGEATNGLDNRFTHSSSTTRRKPLPMKKTPNTLKPKIMSIPQSTLILGPTPAKQHKIADTSPASTPEFSGNFIRPKQEPRDPDEDDEFSDRSYNEHPQPVDMASMLDTTIAEHGDESSFDRTGMEKKSSEFRSMDVSSPGTIQCIVGKRGNPRLVVDGHTFFKKSTYKTKSFWYCKHSRSQVKCPAVCWTVSGHITKWPTGHTHDIIPEPFNPVEDSMVPVYKLAEVLLQTSTSLD